MTTLKTTAFTSILVLTVLLVGVPSLSFTQSPQRADQYYNQAEAALKSEHYLEAAQYYEKFAEAEQASPSPRLTVLSAVVSQAAFCYSKVGQHDKSLKYYEIALVINRELKKEELVVTHLNYIGAIYKAMLNYDKALEYYEEALNINLKQKNEDSVAIDFSNIGAVYSSSGKYSNALKYYKAALAIDKKVGEENRVAIDLSNIGAVYHSWGGSVEALKFFENEEWFKNKKQNKDTTTAPTDLYDKAIEYYREALAIDKKLGNKYRVTTGLRSIGGVYKSWRQFDKAIKYYEEVLDISKKLVKEDSIVTDLRNIAAVYDSLGQFDKAIEYKDEAWEIESKLGKEVSDVTHSSNADDKETLANSRRLGEVEEMAVGHNNAGVDYYKLKQYDKAIDRFKASIAYREQLRNIITGDARRDYLARNYLYTYNYLISSYFRNNDLSNAFSTMENSRAKLLAERLAGSNSLPGIPSVQSIQREIPSDTAIISFANINLNNPVAVVITKDNIAGAELDKIKLLSSLQNTYKRPIEQLLAGQRGLKVVNKAVELDKKTLDKSAILFDDVVNYYRNQLTNSSSTLRRVDRGLMVVSRNGEPGNSVRLDRQLHDFLIQPLAEQLKGKKRLIIIPDGVLSYIPFETLVDENNSYLVEKYAITYTQSMGIMELLKKRTYSADRKPMLAFGGAVYDHVSYAGDMVSDEKQLLVLAKEVYNASESRGSLGYAYATLVGVTKWDNLPGTLSEVGAIAKTVKGTKMVTGKDVTESGVKQLSSSGELSKYKVIHFATHGIVVPEIPELSAIVLSQLKSQPTGEDGYLRMDKIERLRMNADFVNLSACETGLGKIFGGEGVVGLTQSFLLAGANGLSSSLWSVNDVSTALFMVALYDMVEQKKIGYGDAITEIKRDFIQGKYGEAYKSPYYWAPFVYYGKL